MISQNEAAVFVILGFLLAVFGTLTIRQIVALYRKFKFELEYLKHPRLVEYSQFRACEEPHKWQATKLVLRGLPVAIYDVCMVCGTISGNDEVMCSDEVLKQMNEALDLAKKTEAAHQVVRQRITDLTNAYVDAYIRRNFASEINDTHFAAKLVGLARYSVTAMADATEKVAAELAGQEELDARYESWPTKIKGNA